MLKKHRHPEATRDFDGITDNRESKIPWYFSALFFGLVLWGIGFVGYFLFSGWSSQAEFAQNMATYEAQRQAPPPAAAAAPQQDTEAARLARGAELFSKRCAACHGRDGKGGVGPDLTRTTYHYGRDPATVTTTIRGGRPGGMPAFGNQLSAGEIQALATYVLSLK